MKMVVEWRVESLTSFIQKVLSDTVDWKLPPGYSPWFRGQSDSDKPPLPGILRGNIHNAERHLIARFRSLAPMFGPVPHRDQKDEWLYLMQHVGLPIPHATCGFADPSSGLDGGSPNRSLLRCSKDGTRLRSRCLDAASAGNELQKLRKWRARLFRGRRFCTSV